MQKTIAIAATLLIGIFIGVFSVSAWNKKIKSKQVVSTVPTLPQAASQEPIKSSDEKPIFYTSVGGSSHPEMSSNHQAKSQLATPLNSAPSILKLMLSQCY